MISDESGSGTGGRHPDTPDENVGRILVVEDHDGLRREIVRHLSGLGHVVAGVGDAMAARRRLGREGFDAAVIDVLLPGEQDGIALAAEARNVHRTPVIIISVLGDVSTALRGFAVGAEDYVSKPFDMRELAARVGVVLRRGTLVPGPPSPVTLGDWTLDIAASRIFDGAGNALTLSTAEARLVRVLMEGGGAALSRDELVDRLSLLGVNIAAESIKSLVTRTRRKLDRLPHGRGALATVWGRGYRLNAPRSTA